MFNHLFSGIAMTLIFSGSVSMAQSSSLSAPVKAKKNRQPSQTASSEAVAPSLTFKAEKSSQKLQNASLSENVFIPAAGQTGLSVRAQNVYRNYNYKIKSGGVTEKDHETQKGIMIFTRFDHGARNGWAFGGEVGTALGAMTESRKGMKDSDSQGLTDFAFSARKVRETEKGQMFYGGNLNFSPGERVWATEKQSGNLLSGGHTLSGFVGVQNDYKTHILGGRARHDIFMDRNETFKNNAGQTISVTKSNGNIFAFEGFFEKPYQRSLIGASVGLGFVQPTDYRYSYRGSKIDMDSDAYNTLNMTAYGRFPMKEVANLELLPAINYSKVLSSSGGKFSIEDSTEVSNVSLSARWSL